MKIRTLALALVGVISAGALQASPIYYTATDLADTTVGDDLWRYDYEVANETGLVLDRFEVFFDIDDYDFNLVSTPLGDEVDPADYSAPAGWEGLMLPDDPFFLADGIFIINQAFFDPIGEILDGDAVTGFSVTFIWRGIGTPGSQPFDFFDDPFFDPAGSDFTQLRQTTGVPEPATGALLGLGLLALLSRRRLRHAYAR